MFPDHEQGQKMPETLILQGILAFIRPLTVKGMSICPEGGFVNCKFILSFMAGFSLVRKIKFVFKFLFENLKYR